MNPSNDQDPLEARLARLRPADLPDNLLNCLHAAEPLPLAVSPGGWRPRGAVETLRHALASLLHPWPLAYSSVLAAWLLVLSLHLATPPPPAASTHPALAQIPAGLSRDSAFIGSFSVDRAALLTRNNLTDPLP